MIEVIANGDNKMTWKEFEKKVKDIACYRWNCNAVSETVAGIKSDCIVKMSSDYWIAIEITKEKNLEKVRNDVLKLKSIKNALMTKDIYCKCYVVMLEMPTDSMRQTGKSQNIDVVSFQEFQKEYFDYNSYVHVRSLKQFGSLINADTGEPEANTYIKVSYYDKKNKREYYINDLIKSLKDGKRIILKGDFGAGKSRCIKEIFDVINAAVLESSIYTIAINLREHWGARRGIEILTRHFDELGLDAKNFIKSYQQSNVIYLLDGFDEIGTQSWSSDIHKMHHIREMSVCALKDLMNNVKGGVLIAGREYYFNSDQEMINCFGLKEDNVIIIECHNEFSIDELSNYIQENLPDEIKKLQMNELPVWFPKRPLVIQLLLKYASEIFSIDMVLEDICSFWYVFLSKICEREATIYPALNPEIIKQVLLYLANMTRIAKNNIGPITQSDLSNAFEKVTGIQPNDETAIMLQRLPSIGRISADSPDRQFLDTFILDGLRAEAIIQDVKNWDQTWVSCSWCNPLDLVGYQILSKYISKDEKSINAFLTIARNAANSENKILASDIVAAMSYLDMEYLDFKDLYISNGYFTNLSFEGKIVKGLDIYDSIILRLDLTNSRLDDTVLIRDCIISSIFGIASHKSIPPQISDCEVETFETLATTTIIKKAKLTTSQKVFVAMIRKIFFQPGAGRKEEALLRGMGMLANKRCAEKILNKLLDEEIVTRHKGDEGYIYKPVRSETARIDKLLTDLTLSNDPLWAIISDIN